MLKLLTNSVKIKPKNIIKIISIYIAIGGILLFLLGIGFLVLTDFINKVPNINEVSLISYIFNLSNTGKYTLLIFSGLVNILIAYGLWKFRKWSFYLLIIFGAYGLISKFILILLLSRISGIIGIIINIAILYYIYTHRKLFLK